MASTTAPLTGVVAHLGRSSAMGEQRRVRSWRALLEAAGVEVIELPLLSLPRTMRAPVGALRDAGAAARGKVVPEALAWDADGAAAALRATSPDLLVLVTLRAFRPSLCGIATTTVLDHVDVLSASYDDRGRLLRGARGLGLRALAAAHRRAERVMSRPVERRVAAGWSDATSLGCEWVPIVAPEVRPSAVRSAVTDVADVVFVGTLAYPPNLAAVQRLARVWPRLVASRPQTTLRIAGARAPFEVTRLARSLGWTLCTDFDDTAEVYRGARLAVAPLDHTAGIQLKVLDAAAHGVAQVVSPQALAGFAPGFPVAATVRSDDELADAIVDLLDDDDRRRAAAEAGRAHVVQHYSLERWTPWVRTLLGAAAPAATAEAQPA